MVNIIKGTEHPEEFQKLSDDEKILEFCGGEFKQGNWCFGGKPIVIKYPLDLKFLFKYADVLYHMWNTKEAHHIEIIVEDRVYQATDPDPAEAFKQALLKVIDKKG